ncbi:hypothetical protein DSO57_1021223 [Entomophthora muscae]|uniref:Uncharacterized protein n=1 Tax=Entomophthora muscae TaxID=34485 RepID=A0ACC2TEF5_9FUNG|nr:hypothetical protein DSO57_1021223 [Entomophthora muscae]
MEKSNGTPRAPCPIRKANIFSRICFYWVLPTIVKGRRGKIENEDLYELPLEDDVASLAARLETEWRAECQRCPDTPSLWRALFAVYGNIFCYAGAMALLESVAKICESIFLGYMIRFFQVPGEDLENGFLYATGMVLAVLLHGILHHHFFFPAMRCGQRVRAGLTSLMYSKSLHLSSASSFSNGAVINLISNDVQIFETNMAFVHFIWIGPVETTAVAVLLYLNIGIAGLIGLCTFLFYIPLQFWFSRRFMAIRRLSSSLRDSRIRMLSDILLGIQLIKLSSWEAAMRNIVRLLRGQEIKQLRRSAAMKATNESLFFSFPAIIATIAFCTYWALNNRTLTPDRVFVSLSLFNIIRLTMTNFFTKAIEGLSDATVSVQRITKYLLLPEVSHETNAEKAQPGIVISVKAADFMWAAPDASVDRSALVLENISLDLRMGEVVAVVGSVGSGKSSLCMALLGELYNSAGSMLRNSPLAGQDLLVSYSGQVPWILAGSIRENILFGASYDEQRYREVVNVSCLDADLKRLPSGDMTYIGERGVTLSGGQRARVSLARAIYRQADLYILDDPLSAVDPNVGRHLFSNAIMGFLKGRAVVLVTHQLQFIRECHRVVILDQGSIQKSGPVEEVMADESTESAFLSILKEFSSTEENSYTKDASTTQYTEAEEETSPAEEEQAEGKTPLSTYLQFFKYAGPIPLVVFTFMLLLLGQALSVGADYFLAKWTAMPRQQQQESINPAIHGGLVAVTLVVALVRGFLFFSGMLNASDGLFGAMLERVLGSPMSFFHTNPHGRILNRFSKDQCLADEMLPLNSFDMAQTLLIIIGSMIVVCMNNPWVLLALPPITGGFWWLRSVYISTSRQVKRIESASRSPVYSLLSETLEGLATVRAFGAEGVFLQRFLKLQHENCRAGFVFYSTARWLGFNLDMVSCLFLAVAAYATIASRATQQANLVGLSLSYILQMIGTIQWVIRQSVEVEITFIAVERIVSYTKLPQEPELPTLPPSDWPTAGQIEFCNMGLSYSNNQPPVLNGISLTTFPGGKDWRRWADRGRQILPFDGIVPSNRAHRRNLH